MTTAGSNYWTFWEAELRDATKRVDILMAAFSRAKSNFVKASMMHSEIEHADIPPREKAEYLKRLKPARLEAAEGFRRSSIELAKELQIVGELQDELFSNAEDEEDWH